MKWTGAHLRTFSSITYGGPNMTYSLPIICIGQVRTLSPINYGGPSMRYSLPDNLPQDSWWDPRYSRAELSCIQRGNSFSKFKTLAVYLSLRVYLVSSTHCLAVTVSSYWLWKLHKLNHREHKIIEFVTFTLRITYCRLFVIGSVCVYVCLTNPFTWKVGRDRKAII